MTRVGGFGGDGIVLLVTNEFHNDPRVFRTATALAEQGYRTSAVCLIDGSARPGLEEYDGVRILRVPRGSRWLGRLRTIIGGASPSADSDRIPITLSDRTTPSLREQLLESGIFINNNLRWFLRVARLRPDAVYANDLDTLLTGFLLAALRRAPLIYDSHELYAEMSVPPRPLFRRFLMSIEAVLVRRARLVITVNPSIARELAERYAITLPTVIFNCPVFQAPAPSGGGTDDMTRVIYHGGYAPDRGIEEAIEASRSFEQARLFLRGLESPPPHITRATSGEEGEPEAGETAVLLPRVPMADLVSSLAGFDIGVVPYRATCLNNYYSSPNKLFEYMMGGLAIAAADLPEIRRILSECENGLLFDPSDPDDIAGKINAMASDRPRLERMKQNSLRWAAKQYSWETQKRVLLNAVDACLRKRRNPL